MNGVTRTLLWLLLTACGGAVPLLAAEPGTWKIDDFEDGNLKAAPGLTWFLLADDIAGGASEARMEVRPGGAEGSKQALRVSGRLDDKGGWPFAGAWSNLEASGRSVSLAAFEGIRLRVKGPAKLEVGLRSGANNFMADVEAGPGWKLIDVPFATLTPRGKVPEGTKWSPDAVQVFGVTTPQAPGEYKPNGKFDFEVDDVVLYGKGPGKLAPVATGPPGLVSSQPFASPDSVPKTGWIDLGTDPEGDGRKPALPDATRLEAIPSSPDGMLWVRITLREAPPDPWMGVNVALDVDGDPADGFAWWGANKAFKFDRVVTVWCFRHDDRCEGYVGIADAEQAAAGNYIPSPGAGLRFAIDRQRKAYVVGIPRAALGPAKGELRLVAAVGSALFFADDVPGQGAATLR